MISLILPTFRRPQLLAAALDSIARSTGCARSDAEIIVVDNNSGDGLTRQTVDTAARAYPFALRYLLERRQGVSFARNAGAANTTGEFLAFMDDDQQIDRGYLAQVPRTFAQTVGDCVGGWTGYVGEDAFPPWLRSAIKRFGQRDFGHALHAIGRLDPRLQGGNMVIRRAVFDRVGGFRTDVGPAGNATTYGEDIDIQDRIMAAGGTIYYDPALRQNHYLETERMERGYYLRRAYQAGRGDYRLHRNELTGAPRLLGVPRFLWRRTGQIALQSAAAAFTSPAERFDGLCKLAMELGQLREALQETPKPNADPKNGS